MAQACHIQDMSIFGNGIYHDDLSCGRLRAIRNAWPKLVRTTLFLYRARLWKLEAAQTIQGILWQLVVDLAQRPDQPKHLVLTSLSHMDQERVMDPQILRKYGEVRLPRYTSYPTAPRFSPAIGKGTYGDWLENIPASDPVSLYLHIPFCRSMCWYCGCHTTISQQDQSISDYLHFLRSEIALVAGRAHKRLPIGEVHFGGGTPTIIQPEEFLELMALLRRWFDFNEATNIAVEIDPRRLTNDMTVALGTGGVTRASLSVQTFDPIVQKAINRIQTEQQTLQAVRDLRKNGVRRINFDLIYGLPHQTEHALANKIGLSPDS